MKLSGLRKVNSVSRERSTTPAPVKPHQHGLPPEHVLQGAQPQERVRGGEKLRWSSSLHIVSCVVLSHMFNNSVC